MKNWHDSPSSFLVWAPGWMKIPFTEGIKPEGRSVLGGRDSELSFEHVEIESIYNYIYIHT